jgi:predicted Zn-dependent protease
MLALGIVGALVVVLAGALLARAGRAPGTRASSASLAQGITAYREGWRETATERFLTAARDAPNDPIPHIYLSRMAREANNLIVANDEAVKAVQLGPNNAAALRELASTLFVQQSFTGARTFYARAVKADPADRLSQGFLGCSLIRLGRVEEGMRWIERAGNGSWSSCAPATGAVTATTP